MCKVFDNNIKLCVRIDVVIGYYKRNYGNVPVPTGYGQTPQPPIKLAPYLKMWKKDVYALLKNNQREQAVKSVEEMEKIMYTRYGYEAHELVWRLINKYR